MTREEAYREGWHEGRRWAERDISDGLGGMDDMQKSMRNWARAEGSVSDFARAWNLGIARGYRDTVARFEALETSWETFDEMPLGKRDM